MKFFAPTIHSSQIIVVASKAMMMCMFIRLVKIAALNDQRHCFRVASSCCRCSDQMFTSIQRRFIFSSALKSVGKSLGAEQKETIPPSNTNGKARLVFLGTPDVAASSLQLLVSAAQQQDSCFDVVGVVTQPPRRRKRMGAPEPSPVGKLAEEFGIRVLAPEHAKDPVFLDELETSLRPDICITAAYGQYLPKRFLSMPSLGTINIHPSLLPRWRGASPVQRSLQAGDDLIGVTILYTVSKMDAGPIICQDTYQVGKNEQSTDVLQHLFKVGTARLVELLPDIVSGKITFESATPQNEDGIVKADLVNVSEGELKVWEESALTLHNKVRGFSIWPGTWMYFTVGDDDSQEPVRLKVIETQLREEKLAPTRQVQLGKDRNNGLFVVCADGSVLELLKVQPETKKVMDAKSFVNGLRGKKLQWVNTSQCQGRDIRENVTH
jgi:methionyl-tRNA formyltransferase